MPTLPRERHSSHHRALLIHFTCVAGMLLPAFSHPVSAQAPAAPGAAGPGGGAGTAGPGLGSGVSGAAPGVGSGRPSAGAAGQVLTLQSVVARALGSNSGLDIARTRLKQAQESINQVNAQARPQFRLNGNDTYYSYSGYPATLPVPAVVNPTLPDNGQIPTVTDLANNFSTGFIGSNGLALGSGGGIASAGVAEGTTGVGGTSTVGTGASTTGTAGASTPSTGGTTGTTGGAATTPSSPGAGAAVGTTGAGAAGNAPANGAGTAPAPANGNGAPTTGAGSGAAPASSTGTTPGVSPGGTAPASPGASASAGAAGMAMLAYPAIIVDYVADTRTLLQPPSSYVPAPALAVHVLAAQSKAAAAPTSQSTSQTHQDEATGGTGTSSDPTTALSRGKRNTYATGGNVTQYIDLFGLVGTARSAERDVRDFYSLDVTRLQNETALAAKNLFFNVLYTQALVETQQEQVDFAQENLRITQSRLRNGIVSRFDVLTAQTALATSQQQLTATQDQYQLAQAELSYLLGTDPDQPQVLQSPALPPLNQTVDLRQSTRIAERQRPELGQASRNVDDARRQVRLAGSGLLPTLGLVGSGEYTSNPSTVTPQSFATVSALVAVPLDDGGLTRSRVRSAQDQAQTQAITQEQLQLSVALEVRQATVNIRNAQAEVASGQVSVISSQEAVRLARERYTAGLGTFLDVLNSLAQLATARTNLANAQYFYQSSLAQLVRAIGGR